MERLLFHLAQLECRHATWKLAAGNAHAAARSVTRAMEFLLELKRQRADEAAVRKRPAEPDGC